MTVFGPIILLLIQFPSIGLSIEYNTICVRPSNVKYVGQLTCKQNNDNIVHKIAHDTPEQLIDGTYSCIYFAKLYDNCDQTDPNATIKIKNVDTDERRKFVFPIWHLSARRVPIVLGFGIEPVAHKTFNFLNDTNAGRSIIQNDELIMINYEIEITCEIRLVEKNFVIGSALYQQRQLNGGQNADVSITVQLYDTETVAACDGTILIDIHKYQDNHDYLRPLSMSKNMFLLNDSFEIDMQSGAIHTLLIPNANDEDDLHSSDEASWDSTTPTRTSTAEFTNSNNMPALTAKSKKRKKADETVDERIEKLKRRLRCVTCMDKTRNVLFTPCKHACVCDSCAEKIMNSRADAVTKLCPYCRTEIEATTKFYLP